MSKIVAYMPTYSPFTEADTACPRPYVRLSQEQITERIKSRDSMRKPWMYMDAIDSVVNIRPDIDLMVADGRSTDSIRAGLQQHQKETGGHRLVLYPNRESQWKIFNDIFYGFTGADTEYFIYTSSDIIWQMDWVKEALKEFEANPKLQILFPTMSSGDRHASWQLAPGPRDKDAFVPPWQDEARAPVLNAYVMMFRMDFLRGYNGYPTLFRNCYTESFLYYMCKAMGGEMMVLPRGWCFHWNEGDKWQENGSSYYYNQEFELFEATMNKLQFQQSFGPLTPGFLRNLIYKQEIPNG